MNTTINNLLELTNATEIKISNNKIFCNEYTISTEYDIDQTILNMYTILSGKILTPGAYTDFLNNSFKNNSSILCEFPSFNDFKVNNLNIIKAPSVLIFPYNNLDLFIEVQAVTRGYENYSDIDYSLYSHLYMVNKENNGYKVRGVLLETYNENLNQLNNFIISNEESIS